MKKLYTLFLLIFIFTTSYSQPFNNFLTLDGIDDYVSNSSVDFYSQGDFTVELFIKPCTIGSSSYLIDSRGSTAGDGYELILIYNGSNYNLRLQADSGSTSSSTTVLLPDFENKWSHIALTYNDIDNVFELFYNGDSIGSLYNPYKPSNRIYISRKDYTSSGFLGGFIDELRVSNVIRYNSNFNIPSQEFSSDANTLALYHFNDPDIVTQLIDDIGTNHLTAYMGANTVQPVIVTPVSPICNGSSTTLNVIGGNNNFAWTPIVGLNDTTIYNPSANPEITTTYYALSLDSNTCYISDSVTVLVNQLPVINLTDTTVCVDNFPYIANPGIFENYQWSTTETTSTISINNPGTYSVTVTDSNGCTDNLSFTIDIALCSGISENSFDNLVKIFPNPNNGNFNIESSIVLKEIEIYSIDGCIIDKMNYNQNFIKLDLSNLSKGLYILKINTENGMFYKTLSKL